ncbi:cryptochrome/photolyase family protein [Hydrogenophaga intermedia]|uniref:cryptochrome/photolyase family protein n=1 Tax=Hydrogenophaga intermedia TaxID=65786 RepID=UPI00204481EB|nr:deoxyribodipyrimidine photo-lyase [Hydrogenophaga intermedia]MCM3562494.1 DNA photolyase family protein [Hydrogenophaga intermedia]
MSHFDNGLMWFRRDLRASDNAALHHALRSCRKVWCVFVFDRDILDALPRADRRVEFIRESLVELDSALRELGARHGQVGTGLIVLHDHARHAIPALAARLGVQAVFTNHDDEPDALARDARVFGDLAHQGVLMRSFKDHVVFERREVLTQAGHAFGVFTPYKNAWLKALTPYHLKAYPIEHHAGALAPVPAELDRPVLTLADIGFVPTNLASLPVPTGASGAHRLFDDFLQRIDRYQEARDFPAVKGPSYLSVHLRFGTVSIRALASAAHSLHLQGNAGASTWLSELIWRDFYHQILANFPHVAQRSFKPEYDAIRFEHGKHAQTQFQAWCEGRTGYPLVDAAMAQINQSGYMHNRLRMVVASFLVKDLGIHWQWGERYFAEHLIDFDLAANNGGWQWASSSGCDAQPYFRIFNPVSQSQKFDPQGRFIRRYLPQLAGLPDAALHAPWLAPAVELAAAGVELDRDYARPIVDHAVAREKTLQRYAVVKKQSPA